MLDVCPTGAHLSAYLRREQFVCPNGLIGFVTPDILEGYVDASGQYTTATDTILTVNGCLSTREKWEAFEIEWQAYLKGKDFQPYKDTGSVPK